MIMQMRCASYMAKLVRKDYFTAPAEDVFTAATLTLAHALGRDDLGRLAAGAKADIIVIDLTGRDTLRYGPIRDPIRMLVECGIGDDVETVIVDGRTCVENRRVLGVDLADLRAKAQEEGERMWSGVAGWDPLGRTAEERNPWSYPLRARTDYM
jgi:cytosine/adenosine deaminase-related metal-dependent hydrolase